MTDWNGISSEMNVVGLKNYIQLITKDERFLNSLSFTSRFTITACITVNLIGLLYAVLFYKSSKWNSLLRVILVLPNVIGGIILGFVWQFIFSQALPSLGGVFESIAWLGNEDSAFWAVLIVFVWQQAGYVMLIYIASMNSINEQLFEAAQIDGASQFRQFTSVTLPLIVPAFTVSIFYSSGQLFQAFRIDILSYRGRSLRFYRNIGDQYL